MQILNISPDQAWLNGVHQICICTLNMSPVRNSKKKKSLITKNFTKQPKPNMDFDTN